MALVSFPSPIRRRRSDEERGLVYLSLPADAPALVPTHPPGGHGFPPRPSLFSLQLPAPPHLPDLRHPPLFLPLPEEEQIPRSLEAPSGSPGWPVVGNLFQVALSGKFFMHYVRDLIPVYGPIFTLRMGSRTLIIVSSSELAHQALVQKGQVFASRPAENPTRAVFSCDKFTINSAIYGPEWRSLRRNMVSGMLSPSRLREFAGVRQDTMDRLVARLHAEADASGGAVWVLRNARFAVFCILRHIINVDQVMKQVLIVLNPRMDDFFPLLAPFFPRQRREAMQMRQIQIGTLVPLIDRRRAVLRGHQVGAAEKATAPFSYLDTLVDLKVEGRASSPTDPELVSLCSEFINGGTDTTATAIEWGLYDEIAAHCGRRKVEETDLDKIPYLQAFVKELLRKHPPTYFSLTHAVVEPTTLGGYDIPPGVNVDFYLPTISEDPRSWRNPRAFEPERFLSGGEGADMTGVRGVKMIPFGAGRRICPGLGMGVTHIALMLARMVQEFEWTRTRSIPGGARREVRVHRCHGSDSPGGRPAEESAAGGQTGPARRE
ncbi:unnamed protein product [Spirodela intermedia]|uniref:Uncharacterized protein n=1 Tax=Spirodela intermedia TaxID=51605 RepID=A0A7I8J0P9_SPIIN|nr:unnamed protein product [Spirodela intermedia]CAA6663717.1 unnamed protein product [Spirodela intermedia]